LTITGTNINTGATLSLTLSDSTGYSVNIPLSAATSTSITASVPPYINTSNGSFANGTVNLTLTQSSGGATQNSNTLTGFQIQKLPAATTNGNSTLALIQANLQEANNLQQKIAGTAQATPAVQAAIATQVTDLQTLATNIQNVVQNGQSFSLGAVGGVDITVTPTNINDVDNLILAQLQSLAAPQTVASAMRAEGAPTAGCMSAEAQAYANGVLAGDNATTLQALALAMIEAPYASSACGDAAAFALAYEIFAGAGNIGLGITDAAGNNSDTAALAIAALFATTNTNANAAVGLNALLSLSLAADLSAVQSAISGVQVLSQPAINQLVAEATGLLLADINDAQAFVNVIAPPSIVPNNFPLGTYSLSISYNYNIDGSPYVGSYGPDVFTNSDAAIFAAAIQSEINTFNSSGCTGDGVVCSATITPFNGSTFQVVFTINGDGVSGTFTYTLTKTG
jgi:hypothetical protein